MTTEMVCAGCCSDIEPFDLAHDDFAPSDSSHDGLRYWCNDCVQEHRDGHPGNREMQQLCSPRVCPKVPREDG